MAAKTYEEVNYCLRCGNELMMEARFGALRPCCSNCGWVYFADPKVAGAALIEKGDQVLLVRRANDPARGLWTLPAGFIDAGEDPQQAVIRECLEETGLEVRIIDLFDLIARQEHPRGAHLLIVYRAEIVTGQIRAGDDVDEVGFFERRALPPLAFSSTMEILLKA
jgi:ADP-ribose pyrophosphatase YjhB (NUDIX family)